MTAKLRESTVSSDGTLLDAMRSLDTTGTEIALVVENGNRIVGVLTDGDIRRALLRGATMDSPLRAYIKSSFVRVSPEAGRAEVLDLMRARYISQVPIVDADGRLVGLHLLHEVLGHVVRPNWALVMAGGKGTRLWPVTEDIPKPLIRVAGRPILERIVLHLVGFGIRDIFLAIHYLGHKVEEHFGDGSKFGCRIVYLREDAPLGTGGALSLLPPAADPILVMNGDLVTQANIADMLDFHAAGGQQATIGIRRYNHTIPFGCISLEDDRVVAMEEKPLVTHLINAGIYVIDPPVAARVAPRQPLGMPSLLLELIANGGVVKAFHIEDDWIDVGQKDQLRSAQQGSAD